jgi:hypothetical protein
MPDGNESYTRRESDMRLGAIKTTLDSHGVLLEKIFEQTRKTNGRVNVLERVSAVQDERVDKAEACLTSLTEKSGVLKTWSDRTAGGLVVLTSIALPVFLYVVYLWIGK